MQGVGKKKTVAIERGRGPALRGEEGKREKGEEK